VRGGAPGLALGLLAGLTGLLGLAGCATAPRATDPTEVPPDRVERRVMVMGTMLEITVEAADRALALAASESAVAALEAAEARLSTWRDDTELARLNRAPVGAPQSLSPALAADLTAARRCWAETGGTFDPAVGPLVAAWDLRGSGRRPSAAELRSAVAASDMNGLRLETGAAVRERPGLALEEGGFGKGAGLGDAIRALAAEPGVTRATLDLGGQVAVFDRSGAGEAWTVPVADPRQRDRDVVALSIAGGSVSTSGNSERGIRVNGEKLGHILDPRSGEPAADFGSLTVWTRDPLEADCLSTGLYVMRPEPALAWAAAHPGVEVLVLRPRGNRLEALASPGLRGRLERLTRDVDIRFFEGSGGP
jgi:FAD:protein FMN transferase